MDRLASLFARRRHARQRTDRIVAQRRLCMESLETRTMLSGDGLRIVGTPPLFDSTNQLPLSSVQLTFNHSVDLNGFDPQSIGVMKLDGHQFSTGAPIGSTLSQLGGNYLDVAVSGNRAYALGESGLQVLDLTNPASPTVIGSLPLPSIGTKIAVSGNLAYVADGQSGLEIIDISHPAAPVLRGTLDTPGTATGLAVVDSTVYLADGASGLEVINVSDPAAPALQGTFDTAGTATAVAVAGNLAYVADGSEGIQVIDVTDPAAPAQKSTFDTAGVASDIALAGNLAYVADGTSGVAVLDITDPASITQVQTAPVAGVAIALAVEGNSLYVADANGALDVFDVTAPVTSMPQLGTISLPAPVDHVQVVGTTAYVADGAGLQVLDVTNPANILVTGQTNLPTQTLELSRHGHLLFLADGDGGVRIVDIANPLSPTQVTDVTLPGGATVTDAAVQGNRLYVAAGDAGLFVYDITHTRLPMPWLPATPASHLAASPTLLGSYDFDNTGFASDIQVRGNTVLLADGASGVHILDVTNPASIVRLGGFDTAGEATDVAIQGKLAFVADGQSGLQILDISDRANVTLVGSIDTNGTAMDVRVVGNRAYVASGTGGLYIFDVSKPAAPVQLADYTDLATVNSVQVIGNLAIVGAGTQGVAVLDVSDPSAITQIRLVGTTDAYDVEVHGALAYVADRHGGLRILQLAQPADNLTEVSEDTYQVNFDQTIGAGKYVLLVGSSLNDSETDDMDQDDDGVPAEDDDGFGTEFIVSAPSAVTDLPAVYERGNGVGIFHERNSDSGGPADNSFFYGTGADTWVPLIGDWNGDGVKTPGVYDSATGTFHLRNSNSTGNADTTFQYGVGGQGWVPVVGDWDGDGVETVGVYNPASGIFFLRNSNTAGNADVAFNYGVVGQGWVPIAGNWDGAGGTSVGMYVPSTGAFFLKNTLAPGAADVVFTLGIGHQVPLVGNWDGTGGDSVGVYDGTSSTFYLKNALAGGAADHAFQYGVGGQGWVPLTGAWQPPSPTTPTSSAAVDQILATSQTSDSAGADGFGTLEDLKSKS